MFRLRFRVSCLVLALGILSSSAKDAVDYVKPLIGNGGENPNESGGMIPSTAPPFAMTRWVAQTRHNYVSVLPYKYTDNSIHGFQGTHQPAIWMGESGQVVVVPGAGVVRDVFDQRGMSFSHDDEVTEASYYSVKLDALEGGTIFVEQSATSRVGHLRFTFKNTTTPYVLLQATRPIIMGSSDPTNVILRNGTISIDPSRREITGSNPERQDWIIDPTSIAQIAGTWKAYFCARFDTPFAVYGVANNGTLSPGAANGQGSILSGYATFFPNVTVVNVRIGVSFISVDQARRNLDLEIADGVELEATATKTRAEWAEKLDRIQIEGASEVDLETFYTGVFHTLQYPYETSEEGQYFSGYDGQVHQGESYSGYSIWDTYRSEWAWQILMAPERIPGMIQSMLQDYDEGGWLPMWKNIVETNIMVGTHADSLIAEAAIKGITGFNVEKAYAAVKKDGLVSPTSDLNVSYYDREQRVDFEVRAGLSTHYEQLGYVSGDIHAESVSRTLDYSYDDYSISVLAAHLGHTNDAAFFLNRSRLTAFTLYNEDAGFMQPRFSNGSFANPDVANGWAAGDEHRGFTEGDKWAYSFDVVQDVPTLIQKRGGQEAFVESLDAHFLGGHNDHTNEPSHHIPYLYSLAGAASKSQERIRDIASSDYDNTVSGLKGNEDCGQMSAWYIFSALGFYPVNPASGEYVVGSPFFDKITINLPGVTHPLIIDSKGAGNQTYVKSLRVNRKAQSAPIIKHTDIAKGGTISFEMSATPQQWASQTVASARLKAVDQVAGRATRIDRSEL